MSASRLVTIAQIEGRVRGVGSEFILACDMRFAARESAIFGQLHSKGAHDADVTEGSGGIWERLHYDWSNPNRVVLTTTDSNTWGGASGYVYTFPRQPNGTTEIDVVIVREGKNLKGKVLGLMLGTIGRSVLKKAFENSVKAIETRNSAARAAGA
jgi:hypothetical protein